jgi:hypothetical protein
MAWFRRRPAAGVMHHSDRGSQYVTQAALQTTAEGERRAITQRFLFTVEFWQCTMPPRHERL